MPRQRSLHRDRRKLAVTVRQRPGVLREGRVVVIAVVVYDIEPVAQQRRRAVAVVVAAGQQKLRADLFPDEAGHLVEIGRMRVVQEAGEVVVAEADPGVRDAVPAAVVAEKFGQYGFHGFGVPDIRERILVDEVHEEDGGVFGPAQACVGVHVAHPPFREGLPVFNSLF